MPEILLDIKPENVPPIARGVVEVRMEKGISDPRAAEWLARSVKSILYPGWLSYTGYREGELPEHLYPLYTVFCQTPEQAFVAQALRPERAKVEFVMWEDFQKMEEERSMHPLVRKIKGVDPRYWVAGNISLTAFSAMSLLESIAFYTHGKPEIGFPLALLGTGLGVASIVLKGIRSGYLPHIEISPRRNHKPAIN